MDKKLASKTNIYSIALRYTAVLLLGLTVGLFVAGTALAQPPTPAVSDDEVNAIARTMYCPVCENIPLDVCPTQACQQWRDLIRDKLTQGWTEDEIKQYFALQYGDRVLAEPPPRGLHLLIYIIPPLAIPLGIFMVYRVLRSWQREKEMVMPKVLEKQVVDEDYARRLEAELKRRS